MRQRPPGTSGAVDIQDRLNDPAAGVLGRSTTGLDRHHRLDQRPLLIGQVRGIPARGGRVHVTTLTPSVILVTQTHRPFFNVLSEPPTSRASCEPDDRRRLNPEVRPPTGLDTVGHPHCHPPGAPAAVFSLRLGCDVVEPTGLLFPSLAPGHPPTGPPQAIGCYRRTCRSSSRSAGTRSDLSDQAPGGGSPNPPGGQPDRVARLGRNRRSRARCSGRQAWLITTSIGCNALEA